jgi:antitoxin (DNA-binding transcriptional repressor) of toxin-antitoxin stability system
MSVKISTTEAARHLGEYLARIKHRGERFILTKNDRAVAELSPVTGSHTTTWGQLRDVLAQLPPAPGYADDLEKVNRMDQPAENPWG